MKAKEVMSKYYKCNKRTLSNWVKNGSIKELTPTGRYIYIVEEKIIKTKTWHHIIIIT
jgi:predicted site-specific integrase-resolvase